MLAIERGRARQAQAGAKAPVLADEQWAAPAEHATYHRTFDHIINQISDRHDQQQQGLRAWLHNQTDERQVG